jgi:O-antigen ligase
MSSRVSKTERSTLGLRPADANGRARRFRQVAVGALVLMPIGMAIAHRSSPVFLGLAAASALLAIMIDGHLPEFAQAARTRLQSLLGMTILAFLVWSIVSVGWSEFPVISLRSLGEFWLSVAFAFVLAVTLPGRITPRAFWLLALSCAVAAIMMVVELRTGMALRRALHVRSNTFIFNRPMLTLMILLPGLAAFLFRQSRVGSACAIGLAVLIAVAVARSESGAAFLGLCAAIATFAVAYLAPRLVARAAAVAFAAVMVFAPFLGTMGDSLIPNSVHERFADDHSRDRIDIWLSFGDAIRQDPVLGGGFGVSPVMDETSVADRVAPEHRKLLGVGHPHNAAIQVWAELGIVGVVLTLMIVLQTLRAIVRQERLVAAASLALIAGATAVALVGHGAWQGWWAASLGAAIIWLLALRGAGTQQETTR